MSGVCFDQEPMGSITVQFSTDSSYIKKIRIIWNIERLFTHNMSAGDSVNSPNFSSEPMCASAWRLVFYPKGNCQSLALSSNIRLQNILKFGDFLAEFSVTVIDGKTIASRNVQRVSRQFTFRGRNSSSEYIDVGNLFHTKQCAIVCEFTKCLDLDDISPYPDITIRTSQKQLCDDFASFFESEKHSDVILRVEGREIKAHKNILSARSPVFDNMFSNQLKENSDNIVEISDMSYESALKFVIFLYSGEIGEFSFQLACDLMIASKKFMIGELHVVCSEFLLKSMSAENCLEVLLLADVHSHAILKETAMECFCDHMKKVCETTDWKSRLNERPHLAVEVISMLAKKV